jgi:hypothetical protein
VSGMGFGQQPVRRQRASFSETSIHPLDKSSSSSIIPKIYKGLHWEVIDGYRLFEK